MHALIYSVTQELYQQKTGNLITPNTTTVFTLSHMHTPLLSSLTYSFSAMRGSLLFAICCACTYLSVGPYIDLPVLSTVREQDD